MPEQDALREAALELFRDSQQREGVEIAKRSSEVATPEYWLGVCPEMSIGRQVGVDRPEAPYIDKAAFRRTGYFVAPGVLPEAQTAALLEAIERLRTDGWHPIFVLVFDELWNLAWTSSVRSIAEALLGAPARLRRNLAVHYVHEEGSPRGWAPHKDGPPFDGGLSTWVPLTDATLDSGCMYVIPRGHGGPLAQSEPRGLGGRVREAMGPPQESEAPDSETMKLLMRTRALPAPAGSVLGWGFDVWHWGSPRTEGAPPRVSVAYEWLGPNDSPREGDLPLIDLNGGLPALDERLNLIGKAVLDYSGWDPTLLAFAELAKQLRVSAAPGA
jgi:Phytanoyl-CoA dioxygenase (PhyH)